MGPDVAAGTKAELGSPRALEEIPRGAGGAVMSPVTAVSPGGCVGPGSRGISWLSPGTRSHCPR